MIKYQRPGSTGRQWSSLAVCHSPNATLTSLTWLAMSPTQSRLLAYAIIPHREIRPYDGLSPTMPQ